MVFHCHLSNSKIPQVPRTLLSILDNHNNALVWSVSTCYLISKSSSSFTYPLGIVLSAPITVGITFKFLLFFFSSLARFRFLSLFHFLLILLWSVRTEKSTIWHVLFFLLTIIRSNRDWMICLYLKIPENFVHLILQDGFWVVFILLVHRVKFQFFAQFPVDHVPHPVVSSFVLFLTEFSVFISITT